MTCNKPRFRFSHRSADGNTYYWESVAPMIGSSLYEQIRCNVDWFWNGGKA